MKKIFLLTFMLCVACSKNETQGPGYPDTATDFSSSLVSESELEEHGCGFGRRGEGGLICDDRSSPMELYLQKIGILKYEKAINSFFENGNLNQVERFRNVHTLEKLAYKRQVVGLKRMDIFGFLSMESNKYDKSSFEYVESKVLEYLLKITMLTDCIVDDIETKPTLDCGFADMHVVRSNYELVKDYEDKIISLIKGRDDKASHLAISILDVLKRDWPRE